MSVNIHGREYITVAERLTEAKEDLKSITTEVLQHTPLVVVKATVQTKKGTFTGISAANPAKAIEKQSPYEVAETSAVGRALGFAGYGAVESIASAEEVTYATKDEVHVDVTPEEVQDEVNRWGPCKKCGSPMRMSKNGNVVCSEACWTK